MTLEKLYQAYNVISNCKTTGLNIDDKLKFWKIVKTIKPIVDKFNEDIQIAVNMFKPYDDYNQRLEKAKEFKIKREQGIEELPITEEEYNSFIENYNKYNELIDKVIAEHKDDEQGIDCEKLSDSAFELLLASNDWNAEQMFLVYELMIKV